MRPFESILIVADGGSGSGSALERGLSLASRSGARVTVVDVEPAGVPLVRGRRPAVP